MSYQVESSPPLLLLLLLLFHNLNSCPIKICCCLWYKASNQNEETQRQSKFTWFTSSCLWHFESFTLLFPPYSTSPAICTVRIAALRCFVATWGDVLKPKNFMSENSTWSYENYMKLKPKQEEQTFSKVRRLSAVKVSMRWMSHESYDAACCTSFYPRTKVFLFEVFSKVSRKKSKEK